MQRLSVGLVVVVLGAFVGLSLVGGRAYVGVLSGTMPATASQAVLGLAYAGSYFAAVLVAPVLALYVASLLWRQATTASKAKRSY